ncbi:hypothetical protein EXIGLDRAFT_841923 [Exidia glandulosa HHB12029]|uniref:Zn(2)-C6 fungal-type domain-containing protein n=1 Tax=Exidia glandulosa HHB12029 TaxID=1314781 RepID=A0A165DL30_EXIGL|nr:hypothetical protein EXIGLDRAFT_841923 [Exidia glandulosa HHB12029]
MPRTKDVTSKNGQQSKASNDAKGPTVNKACRLCSKMKLKCIIVADSNTCRRCSASGKPCERGSVRKQVTSRQGLKNVQKALCWIIGQLLASQGEPGSAHLGDIARQFLAETEAARYEHTLEDDELDELVSLFPKSQPDKDAPVAGVQLSSSFIDEATADSLLDFGALQDGIASTGPSNQCSLSSRPEDYMPFESTTTSYQLHHARTSTAGPSTPSVFATDVDNAFVRPIHDPYHRFVGNPWQTGANSHAATPSNHVSSPFMLDAEVTSDTYAGYSSPQPASQPQTPSLRFFSRQETQMPRVPIPVGRSPGLWSTPMSSASYANSDAFSLSNDERPLEEWKSDIEPNEGHPQGMS